MTREKEVASSLSARILAFISSSVVVSFAHSFIFKYNLGQNKKLTDSPFPKSVMKLKRAKTRHFFIRRGSQWGGYLWRLTVKKKPFWRLTVDGWRLNFKLFDRWRLMLAGLIDGRRQKYHAFWRLTVNPIATLLEWKESGLMFHKCLRFLEVFYNLWKWFWFLGVFYNLWKCFCFLEVFSICGSVFQLWKCFMICGGVLSLWAGINLLIRGIGKAREEGVKRRH